MKKMIAIAAVALSLTACNSASTTEATGTDSTAVKVDSTKADTTAVPVDTTKVETAK